MNHEHTKKKLQRGDALKCPSETQHFNVLSKCQESRHNSTERAFYRQVATFQDLARRKELPALPWGGHLQQQSLGGV